MNYSWFGFSEGLKAVPTAFVLVGLWWIGFSQIPLKRLPADSPGKLNLNNKSLLSKGYKEVKKAAMIIRKDGNTLRFLTAFFCYNSGVQAVLFLASTFAEKELHFDTQRLIFLVLILQIVAIGGAWSSAKLSGKKGNKYSLMVMLFVWTIVCILGYNVKTGLDFYALASAVGLVMGGTQSLSRATYAKFLPENTPDTASYFSFYDVMDKVSTVMGTLIFGIVEQLTGNMRYSILAMGALFVISLFVMQWVKVKRMLISTNN
jgi:UMF1 family MFS transporter